MRYLILCGQKWWYRNKVGEDFFKKGKIYQLKYLGDGGTRNLSDCGVQKNRTYTSNNNSSFTFNTIVFSKINNSLNLMFVILSGTDGAYKTLSHIGGKLIYIYVPSLDGKHQSLWKNCHQQWPLSMVCLLNTSPLTQTKRRCNSLPYLFSFPLCRVNTYISITIYLRHILPSPWASYMYYIHPAYIHLLCTTFINLVE